MIYQESILAIKSLNLRNVIQKPKKDDLNICLKIEPLHTNHTKQKHKLKHANSGYNLITKKITRRLNIFY